MNSRQAGELLFIFSQVQDKYMKLLPEGYVDELKKIADMSVYKSYDYEVPFLKQEFSEDTLLTLKKISERFWNDEEF
ncbi:MAG: hypothetical protein E7378_04230 [Clostridiales bacterium]|nr:hypothetical protein [Clostridiales bacterium]